MHYAEKLYLSGYTSYPRTETSKYAEAFDLTGTLALLADAEIWLAQARSLLDSGAELKPRQDGEDVGDHPPITPVKQATAKQCGDAWPVYQLICKHFVSSISNDCSLEEAVLTVGMERGTVGDATGVEYFTAMAMRVVERGWMSVMGVRVFNGASEAEEEFEQKKVYSLFESLTVGQLVPVRPPTATRKLTQPPPHLSEGELLGLMEQHEIGTDASMVLCCLLLLRCFVSARLFAMQQN
jgi:DNA topoisomerase-3